MPIVQKEGKDTIIFVTKEEHATPSTIELPAAPEPPSLILPSGEINWNCPCLGGMATGPCGIEFREAFSCFHYSTTEPKGSDCYEVFKTMQTCMSGFPALYGTSEGDTDESSEVLDLENKDNTKDDIPRKKISLPTEKTAREEERPDKLSTNKEIKKTDVN